MRFIIFGAGAIGGTIGGRLHQHGHDVTLIGRGRHYEALRDRGLVLQTPDGTSTLPIPVVDGPEGIDFRPDDVVILAMKTQDTPAALARLVACADPSPAIVCAQNGVENERLALRVFPDVYGMYVVVPATHLEPGVVHADSTPITGILDLGRYPSGTDRVADDIAAVLEASTFSARSDQAIMRWKYAKLLTNLANALEAAAGRDARAGELRAPARAEGKACLAAAGIEVASGEEQKARAGDLIQMRPIDGPGTTRGIVVAELGPPCRHHRDRLAQRRDRAARAAPRHRHPGQHLAAARRQPDGADRRPARVDRG